MFDKAASASGTATLPAVTPREKVEEEGGADNSGGYRGDKG